MLSLIREASEHYASIPSADRSLRTGMQSERRLACLKMLGDLRVLVEECSRPGWDGYGAAPVSQETHEYTREFVRALPSGIPLPSVGAEPDGHLTLEWYRSPDRLQSVSMSPEKVLYYAALLGRSKRSGTEPFSGKAPKEILTIIRSVLSR